MAKNTWRRRERRARSNGQPQGFKELTKEEAILFVNAGRTDIKNAGQRQFWNRSGEFVK